MNSPAPPQLTPVKPRVCMIVLNDIVRDGRVLREAKTLSSHFDLLLIGIQKGLSQAEMSEAVEKYGLAIWWAPPGISDRLPKRGTIGYGARYFETQYQIVKRLKIFRPDIVHAHEVQGIPIGAVGARATGARLIYDAHELYREMTHAGKFRWHKWLYHRETRLMQRCDGIIACNNDRAEIMHKEYGAPFLPTVIENFPPFREYATSDRLRAYVAKHNPSMKQIVLHQGGNMQGRGLESVIDAVPGMAEDVAMVFVGPGDREYLGSLQSRIDQLGIGDRCFLHPAVDHDELFLLTCSADLGIVTYQPVSRNNIYCAPNKLYEYAQAGLPIVGADLPPIRRYLEATKTGVTMDPDDPESICREVNRLLSDKSAYDTCRTNCLDAAREYCWEKGGERLIALYERILGFKVLS